MMDTYTIKISSRITPADLEGMCPPGFKVLRSGSEGLVFTIKADQSGLIGLLRQLHARGVVFESICITPPFREGQG
jgi:hypothetical protein